MNSDEKRERYLASQRRYNQSRKGQARYARYEAAHPERRVTRWEPARNQRDQALEAEVRTALSEAARTVEPVGVDILARVRDGLRRL